VRSRTTVILFFFSAIKGLAKVRSSPIVCVLHVVVI
jgi:hypothetical protein